MTAPPIDTEALRRLADAATPGPWEVGWDIGEGELTVSAGTARTEWDGDIGTPPGTYNTTDRILEWDDVWPEDGGEQREADAEFIAAARTALPALLDALAAAEAERDRAREVRDILIGAQQAPIRRAKRAEARIRAVQELHQQSALTRHVPRYMREGHGDDQPFHYCTGCDGARYPCDTIRALDGDA